MIDAIEKSGRRQLNIDQRSHSYYLYLICFQILVKQTGHNQLLRRLKVTENYSQICHLCVVSSKPYDAAEVRMKKWSSSFKTLLSFLKKKKPDNLQQYLLLLLPLLSDRQLLPLPLISLEFIVSSRSRSGNLSMTGSYVNVQYNVQYIPERLFLCQVLYVNLPRKKHFHLKDYLHFLLVSPGLSHLP